MTEILMIGIGGTGIKTLSHIKSQLKGGNKEGEIPLHVKLLGIDTTNVPDRVQGVDEKLNEDSEFVFRVGDLSEFFNNKAVQLNWFRMNYYRNHPQKDTLLSMGKGAGMHRQIGRLAFHNMLEAGRASPLYRKIFEVFTGFNDTNVDVLVFGSLAGGSGASMVVDIPYLIRNIAKNIRPSKTAHLYGFFALPDAFLHTKGVTVDDNMQARSVAALRELYRFNSISNAEIGFNFNYIPDDTVLSFRSEGGAYKQIYIFDERDKTPQGEDPKNPLDIDIAHGVCATMSSYAWIFADPISINIDNAIANRTVPLGELSKSYNGYNPPVCASFGSFSYVLPIGKLVDSWRYQFGQEIVNELLPCDAEGRFLKNRAGGRFSGEGANSVISVIENKLTEIKGVISDIKSLGFASTPQSYKDGFENNVQQIINRRTGDLQNALLSGVKLSEDDEKKFDGMLDDDCYFCKSKPGMLGKSIIQLDQGSLVNLEDIRANANNKKETAAKLISNCNTALISKVNEWEPIIDQKVANIYTTYKTWLLQFAKDTLNGVKEDSPENAIENKAGKPGWLFGFLEELRKDQIGLKTILESAIEKCNRAINDIEAEIGVSKGNKSNFIDQLEKKPNETNQKMYISKQQEILENRRKIMLIEGELAAVTKMEELTKKMLDEVDCFINLLRIDSEENLQKTLKSRQNEIDTNRTDAGILNSVRKIIKDEEWEQTKYNEFTQTVDSYRSKPSQRILKDIKWDSEVKEVSVERAGEEVKVDNVSIKLHIRGFTLTEIGNLRTDEIEPFDDNEERK
jgi:hypothetical protein